VDRISTGPEPEFGTSVVFLPKGGRHAIKDAPPTPTLPVEQVFGSGSCDRARENAQPVFLDFQVGTRPDQPELLGGAEVSLVFPATRLLGTESSMTFGSNTRLQPFRISKP